MKKFFIRIDPSTINLNQNRFVVHFDSGDLIVTLDLIQEVTQLPIPTHHAAPMAFIDYLTLMGIQCMEMDRGLVPALLLETCMTLDIGSSTIS